MDETLVTGDADRIRNQLRRWRECLVDQTARNPLLRRDGSRLTRLDVIAPESEALFRMLVVEDRKIRVPGEMTFAAGAEEVKRKLRRIRDNARTSIEERGVTTLHLAIGALHFSDARLGGDSVAPLWLVPCRIESQGPDRPLTLEASDDEVSVNPSLELYLRERHKMQLPAAPEDPALESFRAVLDEISGLAADRGWRVEPEAWLSTFSFESLVLWQDLKALEHEAVAHPVVRAFSRVAVEPPETTRLPEDLDTLSVPDRMPVPILETDSSQLEALALAAEGRNLVVHGPPGTGKSQTIANLIADALGKGKTVLFVSAKMAALEVVHRRLVEQGLGDYCLEAHSARGGKTRIVGELKRVLENAKQEPSSPLEERLEDVRAVREKLSGYVRALHAKRGSLERSVFEAVGQAEACRFAPDLRFPLPWADVTRVSRRDLSERLDALEELAAISDVYDARETHEWRGFVAPKDAALEQNLETLLETVADGAKRLSHLEQPFEDLDRIARAVEKRDAARESLRTLIDAEPAEAIALLSRARIEAPWWERVFSLDHLRWLSRVRARLTRGTPSDTDALLGILSIAERCFTLAREVDQTLKPTLVSSTPNLAQPSGVRGPRVALTLVDAPPAHVEKTRSAAFPVAEIAALRASFTTVAGLFPEEALPRIPLADVEKRMRELLAATAKLDAWRRMSRVRERAVALGLEPLLEALGTRSVRHARAAFERRFHFAFVAAVVREDEALAEFNGERQEMLISRFREIDAAARRAALHRVHEAASRRAVEIREAATDAQECATLRRELARRRGSKPLRRLFAEAPHALQALKPCLLMSPTSVSTWLPPGSVTFDLVVFDEASQIRTPQAVPAIVRAKQTVVAGDPKQLPPSSFFDAQAEEPDEEAEDVDPLESLLDECVASVPAFREAHLRWHYRSQDERLIQFSNHWFYEDRLITFPSTAVWAADRGVRFVHVPDGAWDRGRTRKNVVEARRVAELVGELVRENPDRSVGVIAMNLGQKEAIEDAIHERMDFPAEPFFVKSLENVQGDERDVIVVSLGYGHDANGSLALNFGPLNNDGGWRRLNVLVTRAKRQTIIVSSLKAGDLSRVTEANRGASALRDYLAYAERGGELTLAANDREADPFCLSVKKALEERGFAVDAQVGIGGCRIELGVRHPDDDSRYVLGVECDGPSYASARTARDRDLLRRAALEAKGWRLHRVWSVDWFRDRERTLDRLLKAISRARATTHPRIEAVASA